MSRTQIYLGEDELSLLDRAASLSGASRSELVRRAVRSAYGEPSPAQRLEALQASAGAWGAGPGGAEFVEEQRAGDLNERLARLGGGRSK